MNQYYLYPAIITVDKTLEEIDKNGYYIHFPDFENTRWIPSTTGNSLTDSIIQARDLLSIMLTHMAQERQIFPEANWSPKLKEGQFLLPILIDLPNYINLFGNHMVDVRLKLPSWLNTWLMEQKEPNEVVSEALKKYLFRDFGED